jgi:hypothetical protein
MTVAFGTPVVASGSVNSVNVSGVTSGQPIILIVDNDSAGLTVSDNFSSSYTWTLVDTATGAGAYGTIRKDMYIGTGGYGTSGTITVSQTVVALEAISCTGASTLAGLNAVDVHTNSYGSGTTITTGSLTPSAINEGALFSATCGNFANFWVMTAQPSSPWSSTYVVDGGANLGSISLYSGAPTSALSPTWTQGGTYASGTPYFLTVGLVLKVFAYAAPNSPTLTSPVNSVYTDVSSGLTFTAKYNPQDATVQTAYAFHIKTSGGSYQYYNAGSNSLQSSIIWNSNSTNPFQTWSITLPNTLISNNNTYNWSFASQASTSSYQSSFATDNTFVAQGAPSITVTAPTGTQGVSKPTVTWTETFGGSASQTAYQIWVESGTYGTSPGSGTLLWGSGVVSSASTSVQIGATIVGGTTYRVFVQITETGGQTSPLGSSNSYVNFTAQLDVPASPSVVALATHDATTGLPEVQLTIVGLDNQLTAVQSSFEGGLTTGFTANTNTTIAASTTWSQDGGYSMQMIATANGGVGAYTPAGVSAVACVGGEVVRAMAFFHSSTTPRNCAVQINFFTSGGTLISTSLSSYVASTTSGNGGQAFITTTAPSNAAFMSMNLVANSLSAGESVYVDEVFLGPGSSTTWTKGGFVGLTSVTVLRSDGIFVRNAGWPANTTTALPSSNQTLVMYDQEAPPGISYTYQVFVSTSTLTGLPTTSNAVTTTSSNMAWLFDPTAPSGAVGFVMNGNWQPMFHEVGQAYYPVGALAASKSTDGYKGLGGTIPIFTSSVAQDAAVRALLQTTNVLCFFTPARGAFYVMHDPQQDTRGSAPFSWEGTSIPNNQWNFMILGATRP